MCCMEVHLITSQNIQVHCACWGMIKPPPTYNNKNYSLSICKSVNLINIKRHFSFFLWEKERHACNEMISKRAGRRTTRRQPMIHGQVNSCFKKWTSVWLVRIKEWLQKLASQVAQWRFMCFRCENMVYWHDKLPVHKYNYHQLTKLKIIYMQSDKVVLLPKLIVLPIYNLYYTISCFSWQYQRRHRYASEIKETHSELQNVFQKNRKCQNRWVGMVHQIHGQFP